MKLKKLILSIATISVTLMLLAISGFTGEISDNGCMDVMVGKGATVDGSVITSHTVDGWYDSTLCIRVIPGETFPEGAMADVSYGLVREELDPPYKIGEIPQVSETYTYFHDAYSHVNEKQVMIGETTIGQKDVLKTFPPPTGKAIMTIEQLAAFALQRTDTARDAIEEMGRLGEQYGFLPSCADMGECLTVTDPDEGWVFEIFSVGVAWDPANFDENNSDTFGAVWAAQRVPDDEIVCVPNISRIRVIDLGEPDYFMASDNYEQCAIDHDIAVYDTSGNFIWQESYTPALGGWSLSSEWVRIRLHLVYSWAAPSLEWDPYKETQAYPFSIEPEQQVSVMDVIELQRSTLTGTVFDMEANPAWLVPGPEDTVVKSPFATPFPGRDLRKLLNIPYHRPAARHGCSFGVVTQARDWLPDPIGGVMWFYFDNPNTSIHVPIYVGVQEIPDSWTIFNRTQFSLDADRWAFMLADDLVNRRYQDAIEDLKAVRDPLQAEFFANQEAVEKKALELYNEDPMKAKQYLTEYTHEAMAKATKAYWDLNWELIAKYTNNTGLTP
jgi:dipeptidase